jgi:apolipoprotein N-acyltransferase
MHFPALIRQAGQNKVDILIASYDQIIPFDARAAATCRVIENGVSLVRPTGKEVSLVTDYQGRVLGSQDYMTTSSGIMVTSIPIHGARTLYSLIGDVFAYLCVAGLALLAIAAFFRERRPTSKQQISAGELPLNNDQLPGKARRGF